MSNLPELFKPSELTQALSLFGLGFVSREAYRFIRGYGPEDALPKAMWSLVGSALLSGLFSAINLPVPECFGRFAGLLELVSRFGAALAFALLAVVLMDRLEKFHALYRLFPPFSPKDRVFANLGQDEYLTVVVKGDRTYTGFLKGVDLGERSSSKTLVLQSPYVLTVGSNGEEWVPYPKGKYVLIPLESVVTIAVTGSAAPINSVNPRS